MAATVAIQKKISLGNTSYAYVGEITMDSSYATGGEAVDFTAATGVPGPSKVDIVLVAQAGGYVANWVKSSAKLQMFWGNAGTASILPEVTSTTDLSAVVVPFLAIGD